MKYNVQGSAGSRPLEKGGGGVGGTVSKEKT